MTHTKQLPRRILNALPPDLDPDKKTEIFQAFWSLSQSLEITQAILYVLLGNDDLNKAEELESVVKLLNLAHDNTAQSFFTWNFFD